MKSGLRLPSDYLFTIKKRKNLLLFTILQLTQLVFQIILCFPFMKLKKALFGLEHQKDYANLLKEMAVYFLLKKSIRPNKLKL